MRCATPCTVPGTGLGWAGRPNVLIFLPIAVLLAAHLQRDSQSIPGCHIRWHGRHGKTTHPRDMGAKQVKAFLTMLATERKVSVSTHNLALSALLFLYREVLEEDLPWLTDLNRPTQVRRIPSVLTKDEVAGLLAAMDGVTALLARLLYGTGMRLMEGMRLRVKDVDFDRHVIIVREAKGNKDRVGMLPRSLAPALQQQMMAARAL